MIRMIRESDFKGEHNGNIATQPSSPSSHQPSSPSPILGPPDLRPSATSHLQALSIGRLLPLLLLQLLLELLLQGLDLVQLGLLLGQLLPLQD